MKRGDESIENHFEGLRDGASREESFRAIFERFYRPLFRYFEHCGFSREECQDLIQETLLRVDRGIGEFRGNSRWDHWLFRIAANTANKALRHRSAVKRAGQEVPFPEGDEEDGSTLVHEAPGRQPAGPLRRLLGKEARDLLARALEGLPAQMQHCVRLRALQELDYDEIAERLQLSPSTVKVQLFRARNRLRKELGDSISGLEG